MQSQIQMDSRPNPVDTVTTEQLLGSETSTLSDPNAQEEENKSSAPAERETVTPPHEYETRMHTAEAPASMVITQDMENELVQSVTEPAEMEKEAVTKPNAPSEPLSDGSRSKKCEPKTKKQDKGVREVKKYFPSKKAMIDPLKIDMSKALVMPLTTSQLSLQCIECHIIFSDPKSKERHLKLSHPAEYEQSILRNALFACYVCDRHFTNSAELMAHQKAHTERKPFKCPICSQAFSKSSELTFHKKIHYGRDGYSCTDCGKPCKTLTLLKYHRRTHTGERPYVCKECGKRFSMPKTLQKHMSHFHSSEGDDQDGGDTAPAKAQMKTNNGGSTVTYPCSVCKVTFKSTKTRLHHMKTKHSVSTAAPNNALPGRQEVKPSTPIITPISICQPALLQVEPNGPLQKVDANIDTEQIRKLIESLGNVQKVNQVVILGQVPPNAPPLEVQPVSELTEPLTLNLNPPQIDFMGLKQTESKGNELENPMEQTIILEPITPDGQLENPSFSELGSRIAAGESIELTLVENEQTERPVAEVMHQILNNNQQPEMGAVQSDAMDQVVCHNEVVELKENMEQTIILELTSTLIPTVELEQSQNVSQTEISSSSLVPTTELEKTPDQAVISEPETSLSVQSLMSTVELELTPLQTEQQDLSACPFVPPDTFTQTPNESETKAKDETDSQMQQECVDQVQSKTGGAEERQGSTQQAPPEIILIDHGEIQEQVEILPKVDSPSAKEDVTSQMEVMEVEQTSEVPINTMSAQELVKVRKRKPAKSFIFQGYVQEMVASIPNDVRPTKRQRTKKPHLVVKFGPQSKEKKNKKQKHQSTQGAVLRVKTPSVNMSEKKVTPQNKGRKGKREKVVDAVPTAETKSPSTKDRHQQIKDDTSKNKIKKKDGARGGVAHISEVSSPVFKKKQQKIMQKGKAKTVKDGKVTSKGKRKGLAREQKTNAKTESSDIPGPHIIPDSLLLLKGHKQPQLKVHKLDPSKATGQTQEVSMNESQTSQSKDSSVRHMSKESTGNLANDDKKKGGRPKKNQKALSLLSSLQVFRQPAETLSKPKSTRKRKASPKVETEGVITSKRALECKDCGERFSEVSSLQKHKTTVHIVESPGLTYTNGNVFEGVSRLDLYQLPKQNDKVTGVMNAGTGWDTEPEMGETDRERSVSFPALNLSPSSPVHPSDLFLSGYEDKSGTQTGTDGLSHEPPKVPSPSEPSLTISTKTQNREVPESLVTDKDKKPSTDSEVQATADEDIKEDLLLEIDLVTVGGQNERDDPSSCQDSMSQNESNLLDGNADLPPGEAEKETTEKNLTSQTVSCSTNQVEVKEEEEEMLVQKQKDEGKGTVTKSPGRGRRRGAGRLKKGLITKRVLVEDTPRGTDPEREQDDCEVVYEKPSVPSNSEMNRDETHTTFSQSTSQTLLSHKEHAPVSSLPSVSSLTQKTPAEQDDVESGSAIVAEVSERGLQEHEREVNQSPGLILEKFVTSGQRVTADNHSQGLNNDAGNEALYSEEIKVEEMISEVPTCQNRQSLSVQPHHHDVRTILIKEESSLVLNDTQTTSGSRHIRWNVEVNTENSSSPLMESRGETTGCSVTPDFNTTQCIFYPVKEEEREVLLGAAQANARCGSSGDSSSTHHTEHQTPDSNLHKGSYAAQEYQETRVRGMLSEPGVGDFSDGQAELDAEWEQTSDVRDFLLQTSDEEDVCAPELCDPLLDSEAEVMAYFYKSQNSCLQQPHETTQSLVTSTNQLLPPVETSTREPIDYFSKYFSWDCWVDISHCTNKLSNMSSPVSAKEVAQFVGIHIAMGTLKFPSPRLYWEDLTKVPLIANAMPLSRFLELSRMLKFASPVMDPVNSNSTEESNSNFHKKLQATSLSSTEGICDERRLPEVSQRSNENLKTLQTDPLWKVQPLLCRFHAGCRSLKRESDYAVDQYPLPLTGKMHSNKPSLHCTTLIGFGGLLSHVDLKLDLSDKEDTIEKMAPKGSMVFLCKQELSTPVMLERLLVAGVHGAGRVGGARGQIGDEFVSSDGKLMLRRSHCGFILSTAGNCQRNMVSLSDSFEKAQMSARLNRDLQNLYSIPFTASAPTSWPQAVLWYLTDLALVNSWLQYRQDHRAAAPTLTLLAFRLEVSKALILSSGSDTQDSVPPQPPTENAHTTNETPNPSLLEESPLPDASTRYDGSGHWPEQLGEGEGGRCRFGDCQRTSRVLCLKCCVFLCISRNHNCFLNFHSQGSSVKES